MNELGKWLMIIGSILLFLGGVIWLSKKIGISFGGLPGDIKISGEKHCFYFPIVTSIILSILLTIILNVIFRIMKK